MAYAPQTAEKIKDVAQRFRAVADRLSAIHEEMESVGAKEMRAEVDKAVFFLNYHDQDWIFKVEAAWAKQKAAMSKGAEAHKQIEAKKRRSKKAKS